MRQIQIPSGWKLKKLEDVCGTITSGGTPSRTNSQYFGGNIPWLKIGDLNDSTIFDSEEKITQLGLDNSSAKKFPKNTVLLAMYGATIGKTGILGKECTTNQAICGMICGKELDPHFLHYFLKSKYHDIRKKAEGGAQPNINQDKIKNLEIPLPSLEIQKRIVQKLDYFLGKLEEKKKIILELRKNIVKILEILSENRETMIVSVLIPINKISKNWEFKKISEILESKLQGFYYNKGYFSEGIPLLRITDMGEYGDIIYDSMPKVQATENEINRYLLKKGDLIMARTGATRGKMVIFDREDYKMIFAGYLIRFRFAENADPYFVRICFKHPQLHKQLLSTSHGAATQNINAENLKQISIPFPNLEEQHHIVKEFNKRFVKMNVMKSKLEFILHKQTEFKNRVDLIQTKILEQTFSGKLVD